MDIEKLVLTQPANKEALFNGIFDRMNRDDPRQPATFEAIKSASPDLEDRVTIKAIINQIDRTNGYVAGRITDGRFFRIECPPDPTQPIFLTIESSEN